MSLSDTKVSYGLTYAYSLLGSHVQRSHAVVTTAPPTQATVKKAVETLKEQRRLRKVKSWGFPATTLACKVGRGRTGINSVPHTT
jgi:hypothetical protein